MYHRLVPHRERPPEAITGIKAAFRFARNLLTLRYVIHGEADRIEVAPGSGGARRDGLWRTTCFEAFLAAEDGSYLELNFAPTGDWAAYEFAGYRDGMGNADVLQPRIRSVARHDSLEVCACVLVPRARRWRRMGLTAVIAEKGGARSFWALAHPPGAPDFHHPSCFALELPPPA